MGPLVGPRSPPPSLTCRPCPQTNRPRTPLPLSTTPKYNSRSSRTASSSLLKASSSSKVRKPVASVSLAPYILHIHSGSGLISCFIRSAKAPSVRRACVACHTGKTRCSEVLPCQVGYCLRISAAFNRGSLSDSRAVSNAGWEQPAHTRTLMRLKTRQAPKTLLVNLARYILPIAV